MLPHVTKANFLKYGRELLEVTQNFAAERDLHVMDLNDEDFDESGNSDNDNTDWGSLGREASTSSPARGVKRRVKWGAKTGAVKKFRKTAKKKSPKKKSPKKRAASAVKKAPVARKPAGKFQLLPMPGMSSW